MATIQFILQSIILGIVEGITEFLPVSSTGHLIIFQNLINFQGTNPHYVEMYTYVIQLGAILAVIVLYWKKIKQTLVDFFPSKVGYQESGLKFWLMIVLACIPGATIGILFDDTAEKYLFSPIPVAITLFLGAILMIYAENRLRKNAPVGRDLNVSPRQAVMIGLFQCLAVIPGMSRSASTIIGGWVAGLPTVAATEFSFFLAIPVMIGMSLLKVVKIGGLAILTSQEILSLAVGFIVSFLVAVIVIQKFISYLQRKPMRIFAIYRMIFAAFVLAAGVAGLF
ncbi:Undecaprenyl-diphosphatase [Dehalobacter sp. UNSWDHB]|jgi:undecaprenyl-diphosphatase UppP|uniref:undecaprenyl-diphosphate phosphatase n=1 Tax=unclassified Dehalobacter TaxID=2635733 RepID=UPI00028B2F39|nr:MULTISPECIES: undecaprenyl-diphosphate phosphatase [unclassified Dehalobacter]AFV01908.1 Undecaprenyl-diphosphatase [Dehalobacter sp. DCA]AFV04945.1 Undecaprenyl-diphosphatase [Dehalobacter sp. CF]EQB20681.1 Undecaprenyl-diphosphatase [Dehalobacter sp. UNSWDHB]